MKNIARTFALLLSLAIFLANAQAGELEDKLDKARTAKQVKEMPTGYLSAVDTSPEVKALVEEVNKKRKAAYEEIQKKTNAPSLSAVEVSAGKKLMQKYN